MSKRIFYVDAFFVLNFLMDTMLLLITAGMVRLRTGMFRLVLGGIFGAGWSVISVVLSSRYWLPARISGLFTYTVVPMVMVLIAFGRLLWKQQLRVVLTLFGTVCFSGGLIQMVSFHTILGYHLAGGIVKNSKLYMAVFMGIALAFYFVRVGNLKDVYGSGLCQVVLKIKGRSISLQGLVDTGNRLADPIYGGAVHILNRSIVEEILPMAFHLIPYHSLGNENGVIPVVFAESMTVYINGKLRLYEHPEIALYDGEVSSDHEYDILLHSEIVKGKGV